MRHECSRRPGTLLSISSTFGSSIFDPILPRESRGGVPTVRCSRFSQVRRLRPWSAQRYRRVSGWPPASLTETGQSAPSKTRRAASLRQTINDLTCDAIRVFSDPQAGALRRRKSANCGTVNSLRPCEGLKINPFSISRDRVGATFWGPGRPSWAAMSPDR